MSHNADIQPSYEASSELFIKKFKTALGCYVYDVNSNEIIKVDPAIWEIIDAFPFQNKNAAAKNSRTKAKPSAAYKFLQEAVSRGIFSGRHPQIHSYLTDPILYEQSVQIHGLSQLILNLTEQCNMRCDYCPYSGNSKTERKHSNKRMTLETARKAVDFFVHRCKPQTNVYVTFYGGEPLLEFRLLQDTIEYAKSLRNNIGFSFTTNGTLFNDEIIQYLIVNNVGLSISFDGPKDFHDKYRHFLGGSGTHEIITNKIKRIQQLSPEYFLKQVRIRCLAAPPFYSAEAWSYFSKDEFYKSLLNNISFDMVSVYDNGFFTDSEIARWSNNYWQKEYPCLLNKCKQNIFKGKSDSETREIEKDLLQQYHFRMKNILPDRYEALGQCIVGTKRLFVNTSGKFYMCERVGEAYNIGDIDNGFDIERIAEFYRVWDYFNRDCSQCWALRLCKKCFADLHREDKPDSEKRKEFCITKKYHSEMLLKLYCEIMEENPHAFDRFMSRKGGPTNAALYGMEISS
jgi:uncharacterized protein